MDGWEYVQAYGLQKIYIALPSHVGSLRSATLHNGRTSYVDYVCVPLRLSVPSVPVWQQLEKFIVQTGHSAQLNECIRFVTNEAVLTHIRLRTGTLTRLNRQPLLMTVPDTQCSSYLAFPGLRLAELEEMNDRWQRCTVCHESYGTHVEDRCLLHLGERFTSADPNSLSRVAELVHLSEALPPWLESQSDAIYLLALDAAQRKELEHEQRTAEQAETTDDAGTGGTRLSGASGTDGGAAPLGVGAGDAVS